MKTRNVLRWTLPLVVGTFSAILFLFGFGAALRGGAGEPVSEPAPLAVPAENATGRPLRILLLGDSLARGTGDSTGRGVGGNLAEVLGEDGSRKIEIVNLAVNGARTRDLAAKIERSSIRDLAAQSEAIIVSIGGNDLFGLSIEPDGTFAPPGEEPRTHYQTVLDRVVRIVTDLRESAPAARIYLVGLYDPFRHRGQNLGGYVAAWNRDLEAAFAHDPAITVVPTADLFATANRLSADRFHPGDEAYALIARRIADTF